MGGTCSTTSTVAHQTVPADATVVVSKPNQNKDHPAESTEVRQSFAFPEPNSAGGPTPTTVRSVHVDPGDKGVTPSGEPSHNAHHRIEFAGSEPSTATHMQMMSPMAVNEKSAFMLQPSTSRRYSSVGERPDYTSAASAANTRPGTPVVAGNIPIPQMGTAAVQTGMGWQIASWPAGGFFTAGEPREDEEDEAPDLRPPPRSNAPSRPLTARASALQAIEEDDD